MENNDCYSCYKAYPDNEFTHARRKNKIFCAFYREFLTPKDYCMFYKDANRCKPDNWIPRIKRLIPEGPDRQLTLL